MEDVALQHHAAAAVVVTTLTATGAKTIRGGW